MLQAALSSRHRREGKSGQHRAPYPANGWTSLKKERDSATENNHFYCHPELVEGGNKRKGENVR